MKFNAEDKSQEIFIDKEIFDKLNPSTYFVSYDLHFVLFATERVQQWRHSFTAVYVLLNLTSGQTDSFPRGTHAGQRLQYAGWASKENGNHALTFVVDNNLYYQKDTVSDPVQITTNGDSVIFNGVPDWLYEEDVLGTRVTHYSSADAKFVCYAVLNDTEVPLQAWPVYGDANDVFGKTIEIPYPKAGYVNEDGTPGENTKVKMFIYDVTQGTSSEILPPTISPPTADTLRKNGYYYIQAAWLDNQRVMVTWASRIQTESWSVIYNATEPDTPGVLNHHIAVTNGWVEVPPTQPWPINNGESFLTILSEPVTDRGSWRHLALVSTTGTNVTPRFIRTSSQTEEVQSIVGFNSTSRTVYFISTGGDPSERHLYQVGIDSVGEVPECLTCDSQTCRYVSTSFSSTSQYYLLNCRGPEIPVSILKQISNSNNDLTLENNDAFRALIATKQLPTRQFVNVPVGGGQEGRAEVFYPPGHVQGNSYPLLVFAYAGPGSQRVDKSYPIGGTQNNWLMHLKSHYKIVVASLDARGSAAAGDAYKFLMYRKLSVVEIEDQIAGGRHFNALKEVDDTYRSAIFGWSYGGGVAAHVTGDVSKTFQCGVSVAPVATKAYYDTAYTERYLGLATPDDNAAGYNATNVMHKVNNFRDKKFLIAHGTADDNVHFMHATHLIRALSDAGIQFRQDMYVDENHGISSPAQSRHLFQTMTNFLLDDCWTGWRDRAPPSAAPPTGAPPSGAPPTTSLSALVLIALAVLSMASLL